jgi:hypothetical protein
MVNSVKTVCYSAEFMFFMPLRGMALATVDHTGHSATVCCVFSKALSFITKKFVNVLRLLKRWARIDSHAANSLGDADAFMDPRQ